MLFTLGVSPSGSGISDASYLRARPIGRPLSEPRDELFRLRAEPPERPGDRGLLLLGRRLPGLRQAGEDAVLVRRPSTDLGEGLGGQPAEVGDFPGRLERRKEEGHGGRGGSAEDSQGPDRLGQ